MKRTIHKLASFARENGKNIVMECNVILDHEKHWARAVLEWFPNTGAGDVPRVELNLDPAKLQKVHGQPFDFLYRDTILLPQPESYADKPATRPK